MNEMKPEDVMRALACCNTKGNCNQCPYEIVGEYTPCYSALTQDALALLREKDAARKELWEERMRIYNDLQEWKEECKKYQDACREKDAEIERLNKTLADALVRAEVAKVETITEFAKLWKKWWYGQIQIPMNEYHESIMYNAVDQIAKEMRGKQ